MNLLAPRLLGGALLLLLPELAAAQSSFNVSRSNYSGLGGAVWNPATLADNRYKLQLKLIGVDVHATNTAYRYSGDWNLLSRDVPLEFNNRTLEPRPTDKPKLFSVGMNMRGPGLLVRLNERNSVAVSSRVRVAFQGNRVSPVLLQNAVDEFKTKARFDNNVFNLNLNAFAEWNASYARVVFDEGPHFLKAGITAKRLLGVASAYLQSRDLDYEVVTRTAATGDSTLRVHNLDGAFGYSNADAFEDFDTGTARHWLAPSNAPGSGWGADLGVVYEYRPDDPAQYRYVDKKGVTRTDHSRSKYLYRVSVALTDLGSIRYNDAVAYNNIKAKNLGVSESDIEGIDEDNFDERFERVLQTSRYRKETSFGAALPTALNIDVDYRMVPRVYLNAAISQSLRGTYAAGMRHFSFASVAPRLEMKWLEVATPIALINNYQTLTYGLNLRLGPLSVGSNDLGGLLSSKPYGTNVYAELSLLSLTNKRPKNKKPKAGKPVPSATPAHI
ncbi:DUF5723 family protein [Solirubrum puertoriconensis]|uniref:DUF5723 domain-containing protein n=1 Tax=Solirubrum puertoriconensis TaxID=1751427 RepID=A0A9X0L4V2_SOLP1|nr:DUF5723 family protein [Solirubrum puertoriconensis]KUG08059.1 hypothetical protein ASU33_07600 [Solirubrum puertoriconensis]